MQTESTRMNSRAEARFRIQDPNSRPRAIKVIALDAAGEAIVRRVAERPWKSATFLSAAAFPGTARDFFGQPKDLTKEVNTADLVGMVASPGGGAPAGSPIGETGSAQRRVATGLAVR